MCITLKGDFTKILFVLVHGDGVKEFCESVNFRSSQSKCSITKGQNCNLRDRNENKAFQLVLCYPCHM